MAAAIVQSVKGKPHTDENEGGNQEGKNVFHQTIHFERSSGQRTGRARCSVKFR